MTDTEHETDIENPEYQQLITEPSKEVSHPQPSLSTILTELFTSSIGCFSFVLFLLSCMLYLILQYKCYIPYKPFQVYVIVEMVYLIIALVFTFILLYHRPSLTSYLRTSNSLSLVIILYLLSFFMLPLIGWLLFVGAFTPLNHMRVSSATSAPPTILSTPASAPLISTTRCPNLDTPVYQQMSILLNITHTTLMLIFCIGCCRIHQEEDQADGRYQTKKQKQKQQTTRHSRSKSQDPNDSSDDDGEIQRHVRIRADTKTGPIEDSISRQASTAANKGRSASIVNVMAPVFGTSTDLSTTTVSSMSITPAPLPTFGSRHQSLTSPSHYPRSSTTGSKSAPISRQISQTPTITSDTVLTTSVPVSRLSSISVILQQHQQAQQITTPTTSQPLPAPDTVITEEESPPLSPTSQTRASITSQAPRMSAYDFTPTSTVQKAEPVL